MARPVTLFTGQWADLPFEEICKKAKSFGYDGVELACWGDHFDVDKALKDKSYCQGPLGDPARPRPEGASRSRNHLVGQAVCDLIDERHKLILPPDVWGDGDPEGVRKRAAKKMIDTAKACRKFIDAAPEKTGFAAGGQRLHRLEHLAQHLRLPADRSEVLAEGLRRLRQALDADPRRVRQGRT